MLYYLQLIILELLKVYIQYFNGSARFCTSSDNAGRMIYSSLYPELTSPYTAIGHSSQVGFREIVTFTNVLKLGQYRSNRAWPNIWLNVLRILGRSLTRSNPLVKLLTGIHRGQTIKL